MGKKIFCMVFAVAMIAMMVFPASAWVYPDGTEDKLYERYGPRIKNILIHLYDTDTAEFEALKAGDIDIVDWPLSKKVYQELTQPPYNETINVVNYGPEFGLFILDMNSNPNPYKGNPPDPAYPQKDYIYYPGLGNPMANVWLRRAIGHLIDREYIITLPEIGAGFAYPMYTTMPPAMAKYLLDVYGDPTIPWAWEYSPTKAAAILDDPTKANMPIGPSGYREWGGRIVKLYFYIRSDHPGRKRIGEILVQEMKNIGFYMVVGENVFFATSGECFNRVMVEKDFHLYTGGWGLGVDPDHLILWAWDYYWHPGFCYNYGGHNDPEFNEAAEGIMYANTQEEAVEMALKAQYRQCLMMLGAPLYCVAGNKAYSKTNVGGHATDTTEGKTWYGVVNVMGYGIDNGWTFMNIHPEGYETSNVTILDWGFKVPEIKQLNPIYASWLFDWNVLGQLYDSLLVRNASDLGEFLPWMAESFEVGTYMHPVYGECSRIRFTLRPDLRWSDGTPITVADVHFTFVELKQILERRGFPHPWWWSNVQDILTFVVLDPFNFEVLLDVKSYWAVGWIGGNIILPKHIVKPIAETGNPQKDYWTAAELIGSGPWKFVEYNPAAKYILLERNDNFHRIGPIAVHISAHPRGLAKFLPTEATDLKVGLENLYIRGSLTDVEYNITITMPNGTVVFYTGSGLTIPAGATHSVTIPITWGYGRWGIHVDVWYNCTFPPPTRTCPITGARYKLHFCTYRLYLTIKEDITGRTYYDDIGLGTYPYKGQLVSPDIKVDIKDVAAASKAFGTYPGHPYWNTVADLNGDYKIDIKDIAAISKKFGWAG
jgi:ABC-type transport system substrate-binding protein